MSRMRIEDLSRCKRSDSGSRRGAGKRRVRRFLRAHREARLISDFAAAEVASAISRLLRTRLLSEEEGSARLADFDAWRAAASSAADMHAADARLAYAYVRRFELRLRAPDALHLAIARRLDVSLVTLDRRMAAAARELGIAVVMPEASQTEREQ